MAGDKYFLFFFFSSRRRHTRCGRDWSSDVCSSDLREPAKAEVLERRGVRAIVGDLGNPAAYGAAAEQAEVVVHTAIDPSVRRDKIDRLAVETFLAAAAKRLAAGQHAAFVYTSDVWVLGDT